MRSTPDQPDDPLWIGQADPPRIGQADRLGPERAASGGSGAAKRIHFGAGSGTSGGRGTRGRIDLVSQVRGDDRE